MCLGLGTPSTLPLLPLTLSRCLSPGNSLGWTCQSDWSCCYGLFLHFQMPVKRGRCHRYAGKATALPDFHESQLNLGDFPIISHQKKGDGENLSSGSQNNPTRGPRSFASQCSWRKAKHCLKIKCELHRRDLMFEVITVCIKAVLYSFK